MFSDSFKYPGIRSWDTGLLPNVSLPVRILEYPVYTLQVPSGVPSLCVAHNKGFQHMFYFPIGLTLAELSDKNPSEAPTANPVMVSASCMFPGISSWVLEIFRDGCAR